MTKMDKLFYYASNFNLDVSRWNTAKVITMAGMFDQAAKFDQDISRWNTSKVITMSNMFFSAAKFSRDLSRWNTAKVTTMTAMFALANSLSDCFKAKIYKEWLKRWQDGSPPKGWNRCRAWKDKTEDTCPAQCGAIKITQAAGPGSSASHLTVKVAVTDDLPDVELFLVPFNATTKLKTAAPSSAKRPQMIVSQMIPPGTWKVQYK